MPLPTVSLKPDFAQTAARFEAWWRGEVLDRPPVTVPPQVNPAANPSAPPSANHATLRDRWMDVEYDVDRQVARLDAMQFSYDALPVYMGNIGPELTGTLYGCELEFGEATSWSKPVVHEVSQWRDILQREPDFENPYWQTVEAMTRRAIERCDGRYLVGIPDLHGNFDILASLREPEHLCMDLVDDPDLVLEAALHVARGYVAGYQRFYDMIAKAGFGSTTWLAMYHDGPAYVPSCDFWCMLSEQQARELVMPAVLAECQPLERAIFHLDGPTAMRHVDLLLEHERIDAVQVVQGAGGGPASDQMDVFKKIRAAGRSYQALVNDVDDARRLVDELGVGGAWLTFGYVADWDALARFVDDITKS